MTKTLTLRYDTETNRVTQTYWGTDPDWGSESGTTITTTQTEGDVREQRYQAALDSVSESDYDPDTEAPVAYLTYDPDADELDAAVEFQPLKS